jgi:hypothetical protein
MPVARLKFRFRLIVKEEYQPLRNVPRWLWLLMATAIAAQIAFSVLLLPQPKPKISALHQPPSALFLQAVSLGDPLALGRILMMNLQAHDNQQGLSIPFRELDYDVLGQWLDRIVSLDEKAEYPHFSAAKIYSFVSNEERQNKMIEWVRRHFARSPDTRWEWMAHMTNLARHTLKNNALALEMAKEMRDLTTPGKVPGWVRQTEAFILEEEEEYEASASLLAGLLEACEVTDPTEFEFLLRRLEDIIDKQVKSGEIRTQAQIKEKTRTLESLQARFLSQYQEPTKEVNKPQ